MSDYPISLDRKDLPEGNYNDNGTMAWLNSMPRDASGKVILGPTPDEEIGMLAYSCAQLQKSTMTEEEKYYAGVIYADREFQEAMADMKSLLSKKELLAIVQNTYDTLKEKQEKD